MSVQEGIECTRRDCVYMYKEGMSMQGGNEYTRRDWVNKEGMSIQEGIECTRRDTGRNINNFSASPSFPFVEN